MRLTELQQLAPQLHELLARHGASNPALFGSVARDQALPGSLARDYLQDAVIRCLEIVGEAGVTPLIGPGLGPAGAIARAWPHQPCGWVTAEPRCSRPPIDRLKANAAGHEPGSAWASTVIRAVSTLRIRAPRPTRRAITDSAS
jgi:hypothetical protein